MRRRSRFWPKRAAHALRVLRLAVPLVLALPLALRAEEPEVETGRGDAQAASVRVAASERYEAGRVHRWALGGGYRNLWEVPIELPLLDLDREAGGLEPIGRFGGLQTAVLGLRGADGGSYTFRGTDKDPSAVLDDLLKDTIVQVIVQDQMAAQHPGGPVVATVLTRAAGLLAIDERMVVVPDSERLGPYRDEFAGMVGTYFVYPQPTTPERPGFADAIEIIDHDELYARLRSGTELAVDVEAFLRARLIDVLLGDFDRHRKQWRWARLPGEALWQPIPEDRDQAFVRYDGFAQAVMRLYIPILQNFGPEYPLIKGLTLHGWEQDRWLLPSLSWTDWERAVSQIQTRLTDDVIEQAISALPPEYIALDGDRLRTDLRARRDALGEVARRFYLHLAREVDVQLSDAPDVVHVTHDAEGGMRVLVRPASGDTTLFDRRFAPDETKEVRFYLRGGEDEVVMEGGRGSILTHFIVDEGAKRIDASTSARVRIYDEKGLASIEAGRRTRIDARPYTPPPPDAGFVDVEEVPPRDWGSDTIPLPDFGYQPDAGFFLGGSVAHTRYGFRRHPWSSKHSLGAGWAFQANEPRIRYLGQFRPVNSRVVAEVDMYYSGIEVLRFYGFGNETRDRGSDRRFRVRNEIADLELGLAMPLPDDRFTVSGGGFFRFSRTNQSVRLIDLLNPYGNNDFLTPGVQAQLRFDTRTSVETSKQNLQLPFHDNPAAGYPTSGIYAQVAGRFVPPVLDAEKAYGSITGSIAGYLSFLRDDRVTLTMRVGGTETFGRTPYFDLATIGGGRFSKGDATNRGLRPRRLTGDSAVFANTDLRIVLGRAKIVVPGDFGVHGFFDVGRVFYHDESSDDWHPTGGGGVFFAPLVRTNALSLSVAGGPEETLFYLRFGFHY